MNRLALVALVAACSSGSSSKPAPVGSNAAGSAPPVARSEPAAAFVARAFELLARPAAPHGAHYVVSRIELRYVRADGMFDPTYGEATATFAFRTVDPALDPKRPIGAPIPQATPVTPGACPSLGYSADGYSEAPVPSCLRGDGFAEAPTCTVAKVWQRAIADGAPANALASIQLELEHDRLVWKFAIDDEPRKLHVAKRYTDAACANLPERPLPAEAGTDLALEAARKNARPTPGIRGPSQPVVAGESVDRDAIMNAVKRVRPSVMACAKVAPEVKGPVKASVKVAPSGAIASVTIQETPDAALGACVEKQLRTMTFEPTKIGGSFSMPFVF